MPREGCRRRDGDGAGAVSVSFASGAVDHRGRGGRPGRPLGPAPPNEPGGGGQHEEQDEPAEGPGGQGQNAGGTATWTGSRHARRRGVGCRRVLRRLPGCGGGRRRRLEGKEVLELLESEGGEEVAGRGKPLGRVLRQRAREHVVVAHRQVGVPPPGRWREIVYHAVDDLGDRLALEGRLAGEHLVGHDRERVDVGASGHVQARDLLRRHVGRRAEDLARRGHDRVGDVGHAEVHELRLPVGLDHDVGGLDVPVHDAGPVREVHRIGHRGEQPQDGLGLDPALLADQLLQRPALDVLHDEVAVAHVVHADDGGVVEPTRGLRLAAEAPQVLGRRLGGEVLGLDRLDRDRAGDDGVPGRVHPAHRALADLGEDLVTSEPLGKQWPFGCRRSPRPRG